MAEPQGSQLSSDVPKGMLVDGRVTLSRAPLTRFKSSWVQKGCWQSRGQTEMLSFPQENAEKHHDSQFIWAASALHVFMGVIRFLALVAGLYTTQILPPSGKIT